MGGHARSSSRQAGDPSSQEVGIEWGGGSVQGEFKANLGYVQPCLQRKPKQKSKISSGARAVAQRERPCLARASSEFDPQYEKKNSISNGLQVSKRQ